MLFIFSKKLALFCHKEHKEAMEENRLVKTNVSD